MPPLVARALGLGHCAEPVAARLQVTHGGLDLDNFVVKSVNDEGGGMYAIRAITGWKDAGWYPAYWEYITATGRGDTTGSLWNEIVEARCVPTGANP